MKRLLAIFVALAFLCLPVYAQKTNAADVFGGGSGGGSGTVTSVATGNGLTGGTITTTGTIDLNLNASGGLTKTLGGGSNELGIAALGVTNAMLAGSIADSKLSTISTSGKVSDSALSSNVTLLGNTTTGTGSTIVLASSPAIVTPTIASFVNATHDHSNSAGGGNISTTAVAVGNKTGNGLKFATSTGSLTSGRCVEIDASGNFIQSASACTAAAVTSVALALPSVFTISGSPVTTTGTLTATFATGQTASRVLATDTSASALDLRQIDTTYAATAALTGNGLKFATSTGTLTSGRCVEIDANGNFIQSSGACAAAAVAGSGTELQYRSSGTALAALGGSSVSSNNLTLVNRFLLSPSSTGTLPLAVNIQSSATQPAAIFQQAGTTFFSVTERRTLNLQTISDPTASNGDFWHSSTQKSLAYANFSRNFYLPVVLFTSASTVTLSNNVEISLIGSSIAPSGGKTIPADSMVIGKEICVKGFGYMTTSASPPNFTGKYVLGSTVIMQTGANTPPANLSNRAVTVDACYTVRTTGAGGTVIGQGTFSFRDNSGVIQAWDMVMTSAQTVDTTSAATLDFLGAWDATVGGNNIVFTNWKGLESN